MLGRHVVFDGLGGLPHLLSTTHGTNGASNVGLLQGQVQVLKPGHHTHKDKQSLSNGTVSVSSVTTKTATAAKSPRHKSNLNCLNEKQTPTGAPRCKQAHCRDTGGVEFETLVGY
jgi:hypothetical protein